MAELSKRIIRIPPHRSLNRADFRSKTVLVRLDLNVPMEEGAVSDTQRIDASMPTLKKIIEKGAQKVNIICHLGRPKKPSGPDFSLKPIAKILADRLRVKGKIEAEKSMIDSPSLKEYFQIGPKVCLFENLRYDHGEQKNSPDFAKKLSHLGDIFVLDAFANIHRQHASMDKIQDLLPTYAGLLFEKEVNSLFRLLNNPQKPFVAIVGGAKVEDKLGVIKALSKMCDAVLLGGKTANEYMLAGHPKSGNIYFPSDGLSKLGSIVPINEQTIRNGIFDIGPKTVMLYKSILSSAKTIFWNGNLGMTENKRFTYGTFELTRYIVKLKADKIASGGNTAEVINELKLTEQFTFISTGGSATSDFIAGKRLPVLEKLLQ